MPPPRQRIFLEQSLPERLRMFAWSVVWNTLFRCSPPICHAWRRLLLRCFGATVGRAVRIAPSVRVLRPWNLRLGGHVRVYHGVILNCMAAVTVGDGTIISQYAHLCAGTHEYERPDMRITGRSITVGSRCWLAADTFVGPGVTIGDGTILGARADAYSDLPAGVVAVGNPARVLKPNHASVDHAPKNPAVQPA